MKMQTNEHLTQKPSNGAEQACAAHSCSNHALTSHVPRHHAGWLFKCLKQKKKEPTKAGKLQIKHLSP